MSEATMSREDEIRDKNEQRPALAERLVYAGRKHLARVFMDIYKETDYLLAEVERLRRENEELIEAIEDVLPMVGKGESAKSDNQIAWRAITRAINFYRTKQEQETP